MEMALRNAIPAAAALLLLAAAAAASAAAAPRFPPNAGQCGPSDLPELCRLAADDQNDPPATIFMPLW